MTPSRIAPALLVLALALPARAADAPAKPIIVPFKLLPTGHMTVKVKVNGKGPYTLIFDTGAPVTLINNKIAKAAGLLKDMPQPAFTLFGSAGEATIKSLHVGDLEARDIGAVVMDHPTVEAISRAFGPIEGIVGFPFFARFKTTLDYKAETMTFVANGFKPPDVLKDLEKAVMGMAFGGGGGVKVLAPAAQWGILAEKAKADEKAGVTIKAVVPGSAAATAGLKAGDRLLTLDDRWTDSLVDLYTIAGHVKPGAAVLARVQRGGKEIEVTIKPASGL